MKKINVSMMNAEALESARIELAAKIQALPQRFNLNGVDFTWEEKRDFRPYTENGEVKVAYESNLRIIPAKGSSLDYSYEIRADGSVKYYSFFSSGGENNTDAENTLKYYGICCTLLSGDFRNKVVRDYQEKLETLNAFKAEYEIISGEQYRRQKIAEDEKKAHIENETNERRSRLEAVGQVWFDYNDSRHIRYTVKSVTEKTITFDVWRFSDEEDRWVSDFAGYTKRVSKYLLGQKPERRYRSRSQGQKVAICPVGTDDLNSQKLEQPETVNY
jgi:hypothetical protein